MKNLSRRNFLVSSAVLAGAAWMPIPVWSSQEADVLVIGAGLSGLNAASMLETAGLDVMVLEGRSRVGGRVHTLDDVPGRPEAGGQTIGPKYGRVRFAAQKYGLGLRTGYFDADSEPVRQIMLINGVRYTPEQWHVSPHNPFPEAYRKTHPDFLLFQLLGDNPIHELDEWVHPRNFAIDRPVASHFRDQGISEEGIRLLGINNNYGRTLEETSLLFMHRTHAILQQSMGMPGGLATIAGGNSRLPEAMAASLKGSVHLNKVVTEIDHSRGKVEVLCADGSSYRCQHLIVSLPLPALKRIEIKPSLPALQRDAIANIPYGSVLQGHFVVEKPFWEGQGFMPNVWSDSAIERVFASDPEGAGAITNLIAFVNGEGVEALGSLSSEDLDAFFIKELAHVLPESRGAVRFERTYSWQDPTFSGGAFALWKPGQIAQFADMVAKPYGNLHFAGEHTARWMSGMEGAMESGERAALEVLDAIRG